MLEYSENFSSELSIQFSHVQLIATPWTTASQAFLSSMNCWSLLKLMSIELVMPSNHLILCRLLLLPPSVFPSIRVFSNESVLHIRGTNSKYWSFSFSISPSNEYWGVISLGWAGWIFLQSKGFSRVFSKIIIQKHQFFSAQLYLQPKSHIHTWLLEKPYLWLDRPLSAKQSLCFLICCLGLS